MLKGRHSRKKSASRKPAWRIPKGFESAFREFQTMPNIGPAMAEDLVRLKIKSIEDLGKQDPLALYNRMGKLDGAQHDPCVLDTFMAAVDFARTGLRKPWWEYTPLRKKMLAATR